MADNSSNLIIPGQEPLIKFRPFQLEAFRQTIRTMFLLWARQRGKSYYLASLAMLRMMRRKNHRVFIINASIRMGQENVLKEAMIWQDVLAKYAEIVKQKGQLLQVAGFDPGQLPPLDDVAALFESSKLEARIWHSRTSCSRTSVVSPNPITARGYTGDLFLDEMGFFEEFLETLAAVEPFISSNPEFIMRGVTTPPQDDKHPAFFLLKPSLDSSFEPNAAGNYYDAADGTLVHRVDIFDSEKAGLYCYDKKTGSPIPAADARNQAIDRLAFRVNYELYFQTSGVAALSRESILAAQARGHQYSAADLIDKELAA